LTHHFWNGVNDSRRRPFSFHRALHREDRDDWRRAIPAAPAKQPQTALNGFI